MNTNGALPTIYGPVASRRHGRSLGINLGNPARKICTWGCLYCQCGHGSRARTLDANDLPTRQQILSLLNDSLAISGKIDSVTFAGNSEPTAHPDFAAIIRDVLALRSERNATWILNALSNGSELEKDDVVSGLNLLDEAWIKLDCATDSEFKRLNRPIREVGDVSSHVRRIQRLEKPRIQSLFWTCPTDSRLSNWTEENRAAIREALSQIKPVEVHLTTVSREPAYRGLEPVPTSELQSLAEELRAEGLKIGVFP